MDTLEHDICVCLNKSNNVEGIFTEWDFRNAVYKGISLNQKVTKILNKNLNLYLLQKIVKK